MADWDESGAAWQTDGAAAGAGYGSGSGLTYTGQQSGFWASRTGLEISKGYQALVADGRTREAEQVAGAMAAGNPRIARNLAVRYANNGEQAW